MLSHLREAPDEVEMSIKSTAWITREQAIDRIREVAELFIAKNYREIEARSYDPDVDLLEFAGRWQPIDVSALENWTDKMLEDYMDNPFFRDSMFDNYLIKKE